VVNLDFLAVGGSGYDMFKGAPQIKDIGIVREAMKDGKRPRDVRVCYGRTLGSAHIFVTVARALSIMDDVFAGTLRPRYSLADESDVARLHRFGLANRSN
jgi:hypothetical protein